MPLSNRTGAGSIPAGPPSAPQGIVRAPTEIAIARFPIYNKRPANGRPFDYFGSIALPTGPPSGFLPIFTFAVPVGYNAIITAIANEIDDPAVVDGDGSILWAIQQNLQPIGPVFFANYSSIPVSLGLTKAPTRIEQMEAKEGQQIALLVNNVSSVSTARTSGRILGFYYPVGARPSNTGF